MKGWRALLAVVLAILLLVGCSEDARAPEPIDAEPRATAASASTAPATDGVTVPDVLGLKRPAAIGRLRDSGLDPQQFWSRDATCRGADVVLRQRPGPGRQLQVGERVVIVTDEVRCGPLDRRSALDAESTHVADALAHLGRGERAQLPRTGPQVALLLGGVPVGQVRADQVAERRSWRRCSNPTGYAAAMCPVDFLGPFISAGVNRTRLDYTRTAPDGVCLVERPGQAYADLLDLDRLVITPARKGASCASDFRYELFLDRGALVAVNLVLTDP